MAQENYESRPAEAHASPIFFENALFWLDQTYPNWKDALAANFGCAETICIPDSLDIGPNKFYGVTRPAAGFDKERVKKAKSRLKGEMEKKRSLSNFENSILAES